MTTFKEDFKSKFPKAVVGGDRPNFCRDSAYGKSNCDGKGCDACWNEEMPVEKLKVKEVKRQAKVGEWIKIVEPFGTSLYKSNDILKVREVFKETIYTINFVTVEIGLKIVSIATREYVVLENYIPETPKAEPKREPKYKVGDKVKLKEFSLCDASFNREIRAMVFTISKLCPDFYYEFEEEYIHGSLGEDMIAGLAKPYNGKVVCVDNVGMSCYTVGKIYQFKEGRFLDDAGYKTKMTFSFTDWQNLSIAKWLEIVED